MKHVKTQVCVVGAGSGGTGCVYRLIKNNIKTVVVDKYPDFGGTMTFCGVDGWEPGVSLSGIHTILKDELEKMPSACHVVEVVPNCNIFNPENGYNCENHSFKNYPWGLSIPTGKTYEETLGRCKSIRGDSSMKRFQFEPDKMCRAIRNVLSPYKENLTEYFDYSFESCTTANGKITSVTVSDKEEKVKIEADFFVDATGDIILAREAECDHTFGSEAKSLYNEPCATKESDSINAVSYVFRAEKRKDSEGIDEIPPEYLTADIEKWKDEKMKRVVSFVVMYPCGDLCINMLPTMEGNEYFNLGERADYIGKARVYAYWHYLQTQKNMQGYTLKHIYSAGVREGYRLRGKYVLTENDIRAGKAVSLNSIGVAAIADHALDIHGNSEMTGELEIPYEIPIECTMTKEYENLMVASRGASFSHIASSSVRLSRTILSLGESVGEYISKKIKNGGFENE